MRGIFTGEMKRLFLAVLFITSFLSRSIALPTCGPGDYHFVYTECDENSMHWRVAVPNDGRCDGGSLPGPTRAPNCTSSCEAGEYLDVQGTQTCVSCQAGTYSLGGGRRFEYFSVLPKEFTVSSELSDPYFADAGLSSTVYGSAPSNCTDSLEYGWQVRDGMIVYLPGPCASYLSLSAKLVRDGVLKFTYSYPDDYVMFRLQVQNDQCQALSYQSKHAQPRTTPEHGWSTHTAKLSRGEVLLTWLAMVPPSRSGGQREQPVTIRVVELTGLAYTLECTKCPSGTYSSQKSSTCSPCKADSYSGEAASQCLSCPTGQFSPPRASKCEPKPACKEIDYFATRTACDEKGKSKMRYDWISPKVCEGGVALPAQGAEEDCVQCNPGSMPTPGGQCIMCTKDMFSDGRQACQKCPVNTAPNYGYEYIVWNRLPNNTLEIICAPADESSSGSCDDIVPSNRWMLASDRIHTGHIRATNVYLALKLKTGMFKNPLTDAEPSEQNPVSQLTFIFETKCQTACIFSFHGKMAQPSDAEWQEIASWNGTTTGTGHKELYTHIIDTADRMEFMWAFYAMDYTLNDVSIYTINLTNVEDGSASTCLPCTDSSKERCRSCGPGKYMEEHTQKCYSCPENTYVNSTNNVGRGACLKCGPNLISLEGKLCTSDCKNLVIGSEKFDFSKLRGAYQVRSSPVFGRDASMYYHIFNISLCQNNEPVYCYENYSYAFPEKVEVTAYPALVCRATAAPSRGTRDTSLNYVSAFVLAKRLTAITSEPKFENLEINKAFFGPSKYTDVHFYYANARVVSNCPKGQGVVITLRCDPSRDVNDTLLTFPAQCPDGTCDGCTYHLLVKSKYACPLCGEKDYTQIRGECKSGRQVVHYISNRNCVQSEQNARRETVEECTVFSLPVQIAIGTSSAVALLMLIVIVSVCKKNRKLEYKYMKLVQSSNAKDGELPAAESCGLEDGEEEENEKVTFQKGGKSKFLGRVSRPSKGDRTALMLGEDA